MLYNKGDERATIDSKGNDVVGLPSQSTLRKSQSRHYLSGTSLFLLLFHISIF